MDGIATQSGMTQKRAAGGGFTPFPVSGNYVQFYDPSNTFAAGVWSDQSGNSRNASTSGTAPTLSGDMLVFDSGGNDRLEFTRSTSIRSVFWVVRINSVVANQFLLGDSTNFDFHGGAGTAYFDSALSAANVRNGTFRRNDSSISPTSSKTTGWQALCLVTAGNVAASSIAYDRAITGRSLNDCDLRALVASTAAWTSQQMTDIATWAVDNNLLT